MLKKTDYFQVSRYTACQNKIEEKNNSSGLFTECCIQPNSWKVELEKVQNHRNNRHYKRDMRQSLIKSLVETQKCGWGKIFESHCKKSTIRDDLETSSSASQF